MRSATWREFATSVSGPPLVATSQRRSLAHVWRTMRDSGHGKRPGGKYAFLELPDVAHRRVDVAQVERLGRHATPFATQWLDETTASKPSSRKRSIARGKSGRYQR